MMNDYEDYLDQAEEDRQDEMGAALGDPRKCPRHPHVKTSSPDGMFDGPCGECEYEMEMDAQGECELSSEDDYRPHVVSGGFEVKPAPTNDVSVSDGEDDDIPF